MTIRPAKILISLENIFHPKLHHCANCYNLFDMQAKTVVTVRVWLEIRDKVGHASLQTQGFTGNNSTYGIGDDGVYISIYPTGRGVKPTDRVGVPFKTKTLLED